MWGNEDNQESNIFLASVILFDCIHIERFFPFQINELNKEKSKELGIRREAKFHVMNAIFDLVPSQTSQIESPVSAQRRVTRTLWSPWVGIQISINGSFKRVSDCNFSIFKNPVFFLSFAEINIYLHYKTIAKQLIMWNTSFNFEVNFSFDDKIQYKSFETAHESGRPVF